MLYKDAHVKASIFIKTWNSLTTYDFSTEFKFDEKYAIAKLR